MNLHSILSPIDFSEQSRLALRWAGAFATRFNARLTIASVVDPVLAEASRIRSGRDLVKAETEAALREFAAATWREGAPAQTAFATTVGDAATAIRDMAEAHGAGLIAMGTHGLGGFHKWLLGSTTERVLRRTRVPVLAVPPSDELHAPAGAAGQVSHLLAATDFSDASVEAMKVAAEWARAFAAAMTVAHVVEPLAVAAQWQALVDDSAQVRVDSARARLRALAQVVCGTTACEDVVAIGRTAEAIAAIAADRRAQMIVMSLGSGAAALSARPGTIAYRVLRLSPIPVLVVPGA
jgi:nucleotide-binding universal stress UspA family protein